MSHATRLAALLGAAALVAAALVPPAAARSLAMVKASGSLALCAHPNSLPFASKTATPPGFQIEVGEAIAKKLGVTLSPLWITISYQVRRVGCDILLDEVDDPQAMREFGIKLSKPYYRSGVGLAVAKGSPIKSFKDLNAHTKVGVQTGSLAAMTLDQKHIPISVFGYEDDMLAALAAHEVAAAAVTPMSAGYYNHMHPGHGFDYVPPDETLPDLVWNISVGMRHSDPALRAAIEQAIEALRADGTLTRIYARYGITLAPPKP